MQGEQTVGAVWGSGMRALRWFVSCDYQVLLLGSPAEEIITHSDEECTMEFITPHTGNCHVKDKSSQCNSKTQDSHHCSAPKPPNKQMPDEVNPAPLLHKLESRYLGWQTASWVH